MKCARSKNEEEKVKEDKVGKDKVKGVVKVVRKLWKVKKARIKMAEER